MELEQYWQFGAALVFVLALIGVLFFIIQRIGGVGAGRGRRGSRLGVVEAAVVDKRRRLVLVRRDSVEHLIMIGGPQDLVVEARITKREPSFAADVESASIASPALAESPPRERLAVTDEPRLSASGGREPVFDLHTDAAEPEYEEEPLPREEEPPHFRPADPAPRPQPPQRMEAPRPAEPALPHRAAPAPGPSEDVPPRMEQGPPRPAPEPEHDHPPAHAEAQPGPHRPEPHRPEPHRAEPQPPVAHRPEPHRAEPQPPVAHRPEPHRPEPPPPGAHQAAPPEAPDEHPWPPSEGRFREAQRRFAERSNEPGHPPRGAQHYGPVHPHDRQVASAGTRHSGERQGEGQPREPANLNVRPGEDR